jgi:chaperone required for assembly of F1-ATPase
MRKEIAVAKPHILNRPHYAVTALASVRARSSLPWRLAAVVAVAAQIVSAICGVLLLIYWVVASIALIE